MWFESNCCAITGEYFDKLHIKVLSIGVIFSKRFANISNCCKVNAGIILSMGSGNGRRLYSVTSSLVDWAHTENEHCEAETILRMIPEFIVTQQLYRKQLIVIIINANIFQPRQQCCRDACQISERYYNCNIQSRGYETSRDLAVRRLTA